jgi:hypothetical protein
MDGSRHWCHLDGTSLAYGTSWTRSRCDSIALICLDYGTSLVSVIELACELRRSLTCDITISVLKYEVLFV